MINFIDAHRDLYGVEPICRVLPIAPSTYYARKAAHRDMTKLSRRVRRDRVLKPVIRQIYKDNREVYGVRKLWREMLREGYDVARCTVHASCVIWAYKALSGVDPSKRRFVTKLIPVR